MKFFKDVFTIRKFKSLTPNYTDIDIEVERKGYSKEARKLALKRYSGQIWRNKRFTLLSFILPGLGNVLIFYVPAIVIAKILSRFSKENYLSLSELLPYIVLFGAAWLSGEILWRFGCHFLNKSAKLGVESLYNSGMRELLKRDIVFFQDNFTGSLTKRVVGYARNYEGFLTTLVFSVFSQVFPLGFIAFILWKFSPWLVFALVGLMILATILVIPLIKKRSGLVVDREIASVKVAGHVADTFSNMDAVRAYSREDFESEEHTKNVKDYVTKARRSWDYHNLVIDNVLSPIYVFINVAGLVIAILVSRGSAASLEAVFITFSYYAYFTRFMWEFNNIYRNMESSISEAAQFTDLVIEEPKVQDPQNALEFRLKDASIEFKNIDFNYQDGFNEQLFRKFNLKIKSGEKIGLVGHSGGGKTTITKLLLRFMDIDEGSILIGGYDIKGINQKDLRDVIAYVPQEPIMFHRSIKENICYGRLDATDAEIYNAARMAHAEEFIKSLSQGYATLVGERGVKLSGGQRQRIAIARALIKNAPILLLDEATSALDSESEKLIQDALKNLLKGRTALIIAHRLSTIQNLDKIIVLEDGGIAEEGSHKELLNKNGIYARLWQHQSGGFLKS